MASQSQSYDAVVIGSGPNGLAAAIRLALEGLSVKIFEASDTIGGGMRTKELMTAGYKHDVCSAIHPMAVSSPFLKKLPLNDFGLEWIHPDYAAAHPLDSGEAGILSRDLHETAFLLEEDEGYYKKLVEPIVSNWEGLTHDFLGPLSVPKHPIALASFGLKGLLPASLLKRKFKTEKAKALFAGMAAHSILPLNSIATSAIGLVFYGAAHTGGWPLPKGGSQSIADSMADYFLSLGGEIETDFRVSTLKQIPETKAVLFDLTPKQVNRIAGDVLPSSYRNKLSSFKYGSGVFKIDYILKEPVPWKNSECAKAGTVHLGGTFEEIAESEKMISEGSHSDNPFVLVAQQSLFDDSRTPDNKHTLWAYCHVPNGSTRDMTGIIENQIERFAPGFKDIIEAKVTMNTADFENYNENYIGGDINGGRQDITQLFSRPVSFINPYKIPAKGLYFCSSSAPPGGGVHGMCGFHAANSVLKNEFGRSKSDWTFNI
ncbi:FAD-dependent oxidoreductase [Rhodohalobacter barkolensis]|uniref:Pyridine nucleotide-disulfide oxidoreductase domain-containing protein 2 n=1 Tax=Rhodohalobacter barkolensis TaxID=2053187 RepID=A0A2N0VKR1_9BACT|nr:FAD-dependent oxidoreductase [Rhodohalobacter barkolensis]